MRKRETIPNQSSSLSAVILGNSYLYNILYYYTLEHRIDTTIIIIILCDRPVWCAIVAF